MQETTFDSQRLGLHYFPDSEHFSSRDLKTWLPQLASLGVSWVTLRGPAERAVPEEFIRGLIARGIQPIIHLPLTLENPPAYEEIESIISAYAQWGVRHIAFFDRPNLRSSWPGMGWTQRGLVERFLEIYLPLAHSAADLGMCPIFPPLEPGGDYWDTAFLRAALEEILARGEDLLLEKMALGAYAWANGKDLNWGIGGPERWPATLPYITPEDSQDQRGFRVFDWYNAISRAVIGEELPIVVLAAGNHSPLGNGSEHDEVHEAQRTLEMAQLIAQPAVDNEAVERCIPENVVAVNFWQLASDEDCAWFYESGDPRPVVADWQAWHIGDEVTTGDLEAIFEGDEAGEAPDVEEVSLPQIEDRKEVVVPSNGHSSINHYLLLPSYEWGAAEWHLDAIKPFMLKHQATVGYSLAEAQKAAHVTVVGGERSFPAEMLDTLKAAGCHVDQIQGDGTEIARQLASR